MIEDLEKMKKVYVYIDMEKEAELRRIISETSSLPLSVF